MKNLLKQTTIYDSITMNSSATNTYFRYLTDKRLTPPYLKPYKVTKSFRKQWGNVISSFNEGVKSRQVAPLLHQIRSKKVLNAIKSFNPSTLTNISSNVLVSFDYTYNIQYKNYDTTYTNTTNQSLVTTTRDQTASINDWVEETTYQMLAQSPIKSYKIIKVFNIETTLTTQTASINNAMYGDDDEEDLDDLLDLDLNGLDIDFETLTNEETPQLPQELFNNHNIISPKEQCETLQFDTNSKLPTTSAWDTKTGRCVYDFLIHYYSNDKSMVTRMTYHRLFKFFNNCDLPNIKQSQIDIWETINGKDFNKEVKLFWADIVRIQDKYHHLHTCDVEALGKKKRNEYNKIFIKVCPLVEEVNAINIPNEMFLTETNLGLMSKQDFITRDTTKCKYKSYGEYYKDLWSVSIRKIREFCIHFKIPMYCLNQDDKTIAKYLPETTNKHKSLAYKVANGHFYGIEEESAIAFLGVINSKKTTLLTNNLIKTSGLPPPKVKIVEVNDRDKTNTQYLYDTMKERQVQVLNKNVTMKGNQILSFQIENTKYIFGSDNDTNYGKELMGEDWEGEHIVQCSSKIFKDLYPHQEHISSLNNQVLDFLSLEGVKHRTHLGATDNSEVSNLEGIMEFLRENECEDMDIIENVFVAGNNVKQSAPKKVTTTGHKMFDLWRQEKAMKERKEEKVIEPHWKETIVGKDTYKCYDINKCYGAVLKDPLEPWIVCDFNSIFMTFDTKKHKKIPNGLYGIETDDFTLFHGSNIYSKSMVLKGMSEGIISHDNIKTICVAEDNKCLPKKHFHKLLNEFKTISKGNIGMYKNMVNLMTGIMGKSMSSHTKLNISSSFTEFIAFINDNKDQKPFCYVEGEGDNKIYMYGVIDERPLQENSLPIYIQILDESNIRLYDMIQKTGGKCLYRKTDCALIINPTNDLLLDEDWGGYSRETFPTLIHENKEEHRIEQGKKMLYDMDISIAKEWNKYDIDDSTNFGEVQSLLEEKGGLMLLGRAGTGKSYVINNIAKKYKEQGKGVAKIAFTNVASLNICGTTIHKFLKLNEAGDLLMSRIKRIGETIDLIIIDEISMVSSYLWRRLYHLHDITKIPFLLVGDFRQIPPVEDMRYEDYRNHPTLIELGKNSYIELEKIHRYDTALADLTKSLEGMNHIKKTDFKKKIGKVNICYLNKTRKKINGLLNTKLRPLEGFVISPMAEWHDHKKKSPEENKVAHQEWLKNEPTQDIFVYEGMPMIARINKGEEISNNEKYVVKEIGDEITLTSMRASEEGEAEEHEFKCSLENLQDYMLCCYCMTTHKSQGVTINGAVTIHDWDLMDMKLRYTAITRVKKLENVYMI
jgi:hypothetical protein